MMLLYSMDDCPWCTILKKRLDFAKIEYTEVKDEAIILEKDFSTVPQLELSTGEIFDYQAAITWVNNYISN